MQLSWLILCWWTCGLALLILSAREHQVEGARSHGTFYELVVVKEYDNKRGFEAKVVVSSESGNHSLGQDISPLSFIVR